jgi:coenzyme F420-reducing hydrogenase beta subunit
MVHVLSRLHDAERYCLGCFACESVCPNKAVSVHSDDAGFFRCAVDAGKCIDCGRCVRACPQLGHASANASEPECYAYKSDDASLDMSSSGGAFFTLAKWVLSKGGYVCGAMYGKDMDVVYKTTRKLKMVERMRGAKLACSDMRGAYNEVAVLLRAGKTVLFSGLPCHVAALKKFVGPQERLYTVDVLCSGVPSKRVYSKYLEEVSRGKRVAGLSFDDKRMPAGAVGVEFMDGAEHRSKVIDDDPYRAALDCNLSKDAACIDCLFASFPRPGDVTLGDFHDCGRLFRGLDWRVGVNSVLVNNGGKGREMLDALRGNSAFFKKVDLGFFKRSKDFNPDRERNPMVPRFYHMLRRGHSVSKSVKYCLQGLHDVGLTGFWRVPNYGGDLTYYALYKVLSDLGLETVLIEACNPEAQGGAPLGPSRLETKYPWFDIAPWYTDTEKQREINDKVYAIMVGSDQVWNPALINHNIVGCYTLDFSEPWRNTVAYSSSFGSSKYVVDTEEKEEHVRLMRRIAHVSVRESSGVDICAQFGIKAKHVLDPVMLCDQRHYMDLLKRSTMKYPDRFALCFVRHVGSHLNPFRLYEELGVEVISIAGPDIDLCKEHPYLMMNAGTVENWLAALIKCEYLLTDSFHAVALAIVLRKPFIAVYGSMSEETGIDRFTSLLGMFGLEDRFFRTSDEAIDSGILSKPIDFDKVGKRLDEYRKDSMRWLKESLEFW